MINLPVSVHLSVRPPAHLFHPSAPFPIDNKYLFMEFFSSLEYILLSGISGMGLLMGEIRPFITELLPLFILEKQFLAYYSFTIYDISRKLHSYVYHQRLHIVTKNHHSDCSSLGVICPRYIRKCFLTSSSIIIWTFLNDIWQIG